MSLPGAVILHLQVEQLGKQSDAYDLPARGQELVFMGERCQDSCTLADYGICAPWIAQVCRLTKLVCNLHDITLAMLCIQDPRLLKRMGGLSSARTQARVCLTLQVTGFVVNPDQPGKRFVEGVLFPC